MKAINRPSKETAEALVFAWVDTHQVRPEAATAYTVLNDGDLAVSPSVEEALRSYEITPIRWSKRSSVVLELAA